MTILLNTIVTVLVIKFDNAKHFISKEHFAFEATYYFKRFPNLVKVIIWPFVPCHGKSMCDRFFSTVSASVKYKRMATMVADLDNLKEALEDGFERSDCRRRDQGLPLIKQFVIPKVLKRPSEDRVYLDLPNITATLNVTCLRVDGDRFEDINGNYFDVEIFNNVLPSVPYQLGANISDRLKSRSLKPDVLLFFLRFEKHVIES